MKQFQKQTRGIQKGSVEFEAVRNQIYTKMRTEQQDEQAAIRSKKGGHMASIDKANVLSYDSYYCLFIAIPEEVESYETLNILNYFGFPMSVEEDNVIRQLLKYDFGFDKQDPYPLLMLNSNTEQIPSLDGIGRDDILEQLQRLKFIGQYKTHSANERQSLDFIDNDVAPLLFALMLPFKTKMQFYSIPRHMKQTKLQGQEVSDYMKLYWWNIYKTIHFFIKDKKTAKQDENEFASMFVWKRPFSKDKSQPIYEKVHDIMDAWEMRLSGNKWHGGNDFGPDQADFRMFSQFQRVAHTSVMRGIIKSRGEKDVFGQWFTQMKKDCAKET